MGLAVEPLDPDDFGAWYTAVAAGFGSQAEDQAITDARAMAELDRCRVVRDGGRIVATSAAWSFEMTLPGGGAVQAAALTGVTVAPTHRRQGLLRAMMADLLDDALERGEPVSVLRASEYPIYGRFGFGCGAWQRKMSIATDRSAFVDHVPWGGSVRAVEGSEAVDALHAVHDRARRERPGELGVHRGWWQRELADRPHQRDGAGPQFCVVHEHDGDIDGFASYRYRQSWDGGFPGHTVVLDQFCVATPSAHAGLWRYLLDLDLVARVETWRCGFGDPLAHWLVDARRLRTEVVTDQLWLRPLDAASLLEARGYASAGRVLLRVHDPRGASPEVLELDAAPDGASVRPRAASAEIDVELGVAELGAVVLGEARVAELARVGRVTGDPAGIARADRLLVGDRPGGCSVDF